LGLTDQELKFLSKKLLSIERASLDGKQKIEKPTLKVAKKNDNKKLKVATSLKKIVQEEALKAVRIQQPLSAR